jgi:hypothetical protein
MFGNGLTTSVPLEQEQDTIMEPLASWNGLTLIYQITKKQLLALLEHTLPLMQLVDIMDALLMVMHLCVAVIGTLDRYTRDSSIWI